MTSASLRRGWCPEALTPMETGDGWLIRVKPRAGAYSLNHLFAIAEAAASCGNGDIDLTNRANLQIRGLTPDSIARAQSILDEAGLIDGDAAGEAIRNVIVSPFAGLDPAASDIRPLALSLDRTLRSETKLKALPGKFGFAVDGGGSFPLDATSADITLRISARACRVTVGGALEWSGIVEEKNAVDSVLRLAEIFIDHARLNSSIRRMRDLVTSVGAFTVFRLAGIRPAESNDVRVPQSITSIGYLGPDAAPWALSIGLPYGRITAAALTGLVTVARESKISEVRPSTSRALIVPLSGQPAPLLVQRACKLALILDAADPRLVMHACPGAPACSRGTTSTRRDADAIAAMLGSWPAPIPSVHVSGCIKGCAKPTPADFTFVGRDGRYDLIRNGCVSQPPIRTGILRSNLTEAVTAFSGGAYA